MSQLLRVQNFMLSRDGFGSGEGQSLSDPSGTRNPAELASWAGAAGWPTAPIPAHPRARRYFTRTSRHNIDAPIIGRSSSVLARTVGGRRVEGLVG